MTATITAPDLTALPLAPQNPLPYWRRLTAARQFDTGLELMRDSGGSVTRNVLGPRWAMPPLVFVSSPQGAHDVLARTDAFAERGATPSHQRSVGCWATTCWWCRITNGCRAAARCSLSSPNTMFPDSPGTWPRSPNSLPTAGQVGRSTWTPNATR